MIKAIIFDFDGVIVESVEIKTKAFKELFTDYPQKIEEIVQYHLANGGISRYVKFRYIYEQILGQKLSEDTEIKLGKDFSKIVLQKIIAAPFVAGAKEFLDRQKNRYQFFIASGTPEEELRRIIDAKGLRGYFEQIHGSPKKKIDIIKYIMNKYDFDKNEVVFVGDAQGDRISADEAEIVFIELKTNLDSKSESYPWIISDLSNLSEILKRIDKYILEK